MAPDQYTVEAKMSESRSWVLKALPSFDLRRAVRVLGQIQWRVTYTKAISKGHIAYLWFAGEDPGIVARGNIVTDPELTTDAGWDKEFGSAPHDPNEIANYIVVEIDRVYDDELSRKECMEHPILKGMHIIRGKQGTNFSIKDEQAQVLETVLSERVRRAEQLAALEGATYFAERQFRARNRNLIERKKMLSNGRCSVYNFSFVTQYRGITRDFLVAHHIDPLGSRIEATLTLLDDLDLLCPNCHAAVHSVAPPISAKELKTRLTFVYP